MSTGSMAVVAIVRGYRLFRFSYSFRRRKKLISKRLSEKKKEEEEGKRRERFFWGTEGKGENERARFSVAG